MLDHWYFPTFMGPEGPFLDVSNLEDRLKNHLGILLRIGTHLCPKTGLSLYPDGPPDFWLRGLPDSWDMDPVWPCARIWPMTCIKGASWPQGPVGYIAVR